MARPTPALIAALRETARRLRDGAPYSWSLLGSCNCGHLAQTVTRLTSAEIQARALENAGDWTEQVLAYCPSSGLPMDDVFADLMQIGLTRTDVAHLEKLSDPDVLAHIADAHLPRRHHRRDNVVRYLTAWADLLDGVKPPERYRRDIARPPIAMRGCRKHPADAAATRAAEASPLRALERATP